MPTYEYACTACGEHLEVVQSFRDDALTTCPACGGDLRKVFGSIGVVFKGSGFYKTDTRSSTKPSTSTAEKTSTSSDSSSSSDSSASSSSSDTSSDSSKKGSAKESTKPSKGSGEKAAAS
jgi:putative FmdB family regulatory protein